MIAEEEIISEQLAAELLLCRRHPDRLFERHFWIKDKIGEIRPITRLKLAQRKTLAVLRYLRGKNLPARVVIGKSRKQGESSIIAADCFEQVISRETDALVLAHDKDTSEYIFGIYQRYYNNYDLPKPGLYKGKSNVRKMRFDGHDGKIDVETANNKNAGTGLTPQYVHNSEMAKWERGDETLISLLQSVGKTAGTTVIDESTFNGQEGTFLPTWEAAYENSKLTFGENLAVNFEVLKPDKWNGYAPIFISVLDDEDARLPFVSEDHRISFNQTLDDYEKMLVDKMRATEEFLNWRRDTLKNECRGKLDIFKQEYPTTPEEAVRVSGNPRFSIACLDAMPIEDPRRGFLARGEGWDRKIVFKYDSGENLYLYRNPIAGHRYAIGTDVAEGLMDSQARDPDDSVSSVHDLDHGGEQVAVLEGRISEEHLVAPLAVLGEWYNDAWLVTESNSTGKHVCIELGKIYKRRDRLYHRDDWDQEKSRHNRAIGHRTHSGNRHLLVGNLANKIEENAILIHHKKTRDQLRFFVRKSGRDEAGEGRHDDHVIAVGLAAIGMDSYPVDYAAQIQSPARQRELAEARATADPYTGY